MITYSKSDYIKAKRDSWKVVEAFNGIKPSLIKNSAKTRKIESLEKIEIFFAKTRHWFNLPHTMTNMKSIKRQNGSTRALLNFSQSEKSSLTRGGGGGVGVR